MYVVVYGPVHKLLDKEFATLSLKLSIDWLIAKNAPFTNSAFYHDYKKDWLQTWF